VLVVIPNNIRLCAILSYLKKASGDWAKAGRLRSGGQRRWARMPSRMVYPDDYDKQK